MSSFVRKNMRLYLGQDFVERLTGPVVTCAPGSVTLILLGVI